jgi:hypothetical protein
MNNIISVAHKNGLSRHETSIVKPFPVYLQQDLLFEEEINLKGLIANQKRYTKEVIYGHYSVLGFFITHNSDLYTLPTNLQFGLDYKKASINKRKEISPTVYNAFSVTISNFQSLGSEYSYESYNTFYRNGNIYMPYFMHTSDITTDLILYLKVFGY